MDKKLIAIKYLSHKFWIDFSCTLLLSSNLLIKSSIIDFLAMFLRINQVNSWIFCIFLLINLFFLQKTDETENGKDRLAVLDFI